MKDHPIGGLNSPNFHSIVLRNWQQATGRTIGQEGYVGLQFFVTIRPSLGFCIEQRGPGGDPWFNKRLHLPFDAACRKSRREAFARALLLLDGEYILGDYSGKVPLYERLSPIEVPSFGSYIREMTHNEKGDYIDDEAEAFWKMWLQIQRKKFL